MDDRSFDQTAEAKARAGARYIRFFEEIGIDDVPLVGGKNASLGEMYQELSAKGVPVPNGFAITAEAYRHMLEAAGAWQRCTTTLDGLDVADVDDLARRAKRAREIVYGAACPRILPTRSSTAYGALQPRSTAKL